MAKFGLPTYPVCNGMTVGSRADHEIEWLLANGYIQGQGIQYLTKEEDGYLLMEQCDGGDTVEGGDDDWKPLVQRRNIDIASWFWYDRI